MTETPAGFAAMAAIDVSAKTEKKGKFSYLSWPFAVAEFRKNCPNGTWTTIKHNGSPVITTEQGHFVEVEVTPDVEHPLVKFAQIHPILNSNNKPVEKPDAFQVNTSIQRCLVKAIAIATGIGLYIYAGEDLPDEGDNKKPAADQEANETCAELCAEMEKADSLESLAAWAAASKPQIDVLPEIQKNKVRGYYRQVEAMLKEKAGK